MSSDKILKNVKSILKEASWKDKVVDLDALLFGDKVQDEAPAEEDFKNRYGIDKKSVYDQHVNKLKSYERELPAVAKKGIDLLDELESIESEFDANQKDNNLKQKRKQKRKELKDIKSRFHFLKYAIKELKEKIKARPEKQKSDEEEIQSDQEAGPETSDIYTAFEDEPGSRINIGSESEAEFANVPPLRRYKSNAYHSTQRKMSILSPIVEEILESKSLNYYRKYLYLYYIRHYLNVNKTITKKDGKAVISTANPDLYNLNRGKYYAFVDKFTFSSGEEPTLKNLRDLLKSVSARIQYKISTTDKGVTRALPSRIGSSLSNSGNENVETVYQFKKMVSDAGTKNISAAEYIEEFIEGHIAFKEELNQSKSDDEIDSGLDQISSNQEKIEIKKSLSDIEITEYDRETIAILEEERLEEERQYEIEVAYINDNTPEMFGGTVHYQDTEAILNDLPCAKRDALNRIDLIKNNILNCLRFFDFNLNEEGKKVYYIENKSSYLQIENFLKKAYKLYMPFLKINSSDDDPIFEEFSRENEEKEYSKRKTKYYKDRFFYPVYQYLLTCIKKFSDLKRENNSENIINQENKLFSLLSYFVREVTEEDLEKISKGSKFIYNLSYIETVYNNMLVDVDPIIIYSTKDQITKPWKEIRKKYGNLINLGVEIEEVVKLQDFIESLNRPIKLKELEVYFPDLNSESAIRAHLLKVFDLDDWAKSNLEQISEIYYRAIKIYENFLKTNFDDEIFDFKNPFEEYENAKIDSYGNPLSGSSEQIFNVITKENLRLYFEEVKNKQRFIETIQDSDEKERNLSPEIYSIIDNFVINENSAIRKFVSTNLFEYYVSNVYNPFYNEMFVELCRYFESNYSQTEIGINIDSYSSVKQWKDDFDSDGSYGKNFIHTLANIFSNRSDVKKEYEFFPESRVNFKKEKLKKIKNVVSSGIKKLIALNKKNDEPESKIQVLSALLSQSDLVSENLFEEFKDENSQFNKLRNDYMTVNSNTSDDFYEFIRNSQKDIIQKQKEKTQITQIEENPKTIENLKEYEFDYDQYKDILKNNPKKAEEYIDDTIEFFEEDIDDPESVRIEFEFLKSVRARDEYLYNNESSSEEFDYSGFDFEIIKAMIMNAIERLKSNKLSMEDFENNEDGTKNENAEELYRIYKMQVGTLDIDDFDSPEDFAEFTDSISNLQTVNIQKIGTQVKRILNKYINDIIEKGREALAESKEK